MYKHRFNRRMVGFALPTILVVSVVMLTVLVGSVASVGSVRASMNEQHYGQLANNAAESGVAYARNCMSQSSQVALWSESGRTLRPNTDCAGNELTGVSQYVHESSRVTTSFSVGQVVDDVGGARFSANGTASLTRTSDALAYRTYARTASFKSNSAAYAATKSTSGYYLVCGIIDSKTWCWGLNDYGQLGDGTTNNSDVPVRVSRQVGGLSGDNDTDVAAGDSYACAISAGEVYCWGRNEYGQLGNGTTASSRYPVRVDQSTGLAGKVITQIVATEKTVCVIAAGDVYCWGKGIYGELGNGSTTSRTRPVKVSVIGATASPSRPVTKLATTPNARHVCAIAGDRAYCWGGNDNGQLGDGTYYDKLTPVAVYTAGVLGSKVVTDIAVGGWIYGSEYAGHSCAVADRDIYCWGVNDEGQIGNGLVGGDYQRPVKVTAGLPPSQIDQVATSYSTTCARSKNNIWCWGINDYGQLGIDATGGRSTPTSVVMTEPGLSGATVTNLSAGVNRSCIIADARTYCWGRNDTGQIGDGTTIHRYRPTEASFLRQNLPPLVY